MISSLFKKIRSEIYIFILFILNISIINLFNFGASASVKLILILSVIISSYIYSIFDSGAVSQFQLNEIIIPINNNKVTSLVEIYNTEYRWRTDIIIEYFFKFLYIILFSKILSRITPLHIDKKEIKKELFTLRSIYIFPAIYFIATWFMFRSTAENFYESGFSSLNSIINIVDFIFLVLYLLLPLYFIIKRSLIKKIKDINYILYLRSFSGFSDRSAIIDISRGIKNILPFLFVVPIKNKIRDWDPFIISFIPFSLLNSYRNTPIYITMKTNDWKENVNELIRNSKCIIIDISNITVSVKYEVSSIKNNKKMSSTIYISENSLKNIKKNNPDIYEAIDIGNFIKYNKSKNFLKNSIFIMVSFTSLLFIDLLVYLSQVDIEYYKMIILYLANVIFVIYILLVSYKKSLKKDFKLKVRKKVLKILKI